MLTKQERFDLDLVHGIATGPAVHRGAWANVESKRRHSTGGGVC